MGGCLLRLGRQQHVSLGWPLLTIRPLPSPVLHSFYIDSGELPLLVLPMFISFDFANDDDFCLKSWATTHHWYAIHFTVCQQLYITLDLVYFIALH